MKPPSSGADDVRARLREQPAPVRYDVERGLARHRQLIAADAPLPEWAHDLPPPRRASWLRRAGWITGILSVAVVIWLRAAPEPSAAPAHVGAQTRVPPTSHADDVASTRAPAAGTSAHSKPSEVSTLASHAAAQLQAPPVQPLDEAQPSVPNTAAELPAAIVQRERHAGITREDAVPRASKREHGPRSAQVETPQDNLELRQLVEAERALPSDPLRALRLAREGELDFRSGYFAPERRYIEVMALFALGRLGEAHAQAAAFLRDYPSAPYRRKVELAILRQPQR